MEHDRTAVDRAVDRIRVLDVEAHDLERVGDRGREQLEVAAIVARVVVHRRPHARAARDQQLDQVAADESARAGDQHLLPCDVHRHLGEMGADRNPRQRRQDRTGLSTEPRAPIIGDARPAPPRRPPAARRSWRS